MVGYLAHTGAGGRVHLTVYQVRGLTLFAARLPGWAGGRAARRRTARALHLLGRAGCRRLLAPCALDPALPVVHTGALWRALAAPLALAALDLEGISRQEAVVALEFDRVTRPVLLACRQLARTVRALALPAGCDASLGWQLQREGGVALLPAEEASLTLSFFPELEAAEGRLCLGGEDPALSGRFALRLPGMGAPPDAPSVPLLAALLDAGRLGAEEIAVSALSAPGRGAPAQPERWRQSAPR